MNKFVYSPWGFLLPGSVNDYMLSISEFKKLLGDEANNYSDDEIREIRDAQQSLVEIIFQKWKEDRKRGII